jgi:prevent-host-death family protein
MRPLQIATDIVPIAKFKARASELVHKAREGRPTIITLNGEAAAVLIPAQEYDAQGYAAEVRRGIEEGLADGKAGRVLTSEQLDEWADRRYGPLRGRRSKGRRRR